jgi:tetratricopeptide (TPR) repeat protein
MYTWDWDEAEAAFRRAIELNPNNAGDRANYALLLCGMLRFDEAMQQIERAIELDPLNPGHRNFYGAVLSLARRYDDAIAQYQNLLQMAPDHPAALAGLSSVYHAKGMHDEEVAALRSSYTEMGFTEAEEALASFHAEGDYRRAMHRMADTLVALRSVRYVNATDIARFYVKAGENSQALDWLERAFEERDAGMPWLSAHPLYDPLRDNPRFQALLQRMNLPN